jgi:hypothetical protein
MDDKNAERPLCSKCLQKPKEGETEKPTRTRKPRADRGAKRPKCGPFILQELVEAKDGKGVWDDYSNQTTELKAWAAVDKAGCFRVVRVHGEQKTASEQTVIKFE